MLQRILGFTLSVGNLTRSVRAYERALGWHVSDSGRVSAANAARWNSPGAANARYAELREPGGAPAWLRLIEQPPTPGHEPLRTLGWAAVEILVRDPYALARRLDAADFRVAVAPRPIPWDPDIHAMQAVGPDGELLYLTRLPSERTILDLTPARAEVDRAFIAVLASSQLEASLQFYRETLATPVLEPASTVVQVVNDAFALAADSRTRLAVVKLPRDFLIEIDEYPAAAQRRQYTEGRLPPGISMVTFETDREAISSGPLIVGPDGEWLDLHPVTT